MFDSVLIANRGEIALRVIRSCRALGLRSVAIHTDLDRAAPHVRVADDAVRVESYLDIDEVVAAAQASGAGAIHPGYGFLSERAAFARAVADAGLVLVGPSAEVMDRMGRKDAAREVAIAAGVPVVPSYGLDDPAEELGFPILVKAASGGGGKGMRVVRSLEEYADGVAAAGREAASAFGDDTLLIEKYVERGRHIEVQVLADTHGNVVHLFERDCSTQRRHQKVLEEAPAPTISDIARELVTSAAVALAREVGYVGAGTVEFLLDMQPSRDDDPGVYFLEMNTRLQVEHPVTELAVSVAGEEPDLVALQLQVAQGRPLPFTQEQVAITGHAIEARVYAEDPFHGFLPQAGVATLVRWPERRARVDAALESGQEVSTSYDPMLGKVIASGPDRETARRSLVAALDHTAVLGLTTNLGFLRALTAGEEFRDCTIDTAWLDRNTVDPPSADLARVIAAKAYAEGLVDLADGPLAADGWRASGSRAPVLLELDRLMRVEAIPGGATVDGREVHTISSRDLGGARHLVTIVDGRRHEAVVAVHPHGIEVVHQGRRHVFERPDVFGDVGAAVGDGTVVAPMPGTVLAVAVEEGEQVSADQSLGAMEAMKMELSLKAPFAGTVTAVRATVGEQVALGAVLFEVEKGDSE